VKVTGIEARSYSLPLDPPFNAAWDPKPRTTFGETIVIVETDDGARGYAGGAPVPDAALLESLLTGMDPSDTNRVFEICQSVDFHHGRNWTVEVAVWDLIARAAGKPLWQFLGGSNDHFRAYASTGERVEPAMRVERLLAWQEKGIRAAKIRFNHSNWREDVRVVQAAREAVGPSMDLMVDANHGWRMAGDLSHRWDLAMAQQCARALGDLNVFWLEEPLDTADIDGYAALRETSPIPIAAGEMVRSLSETRRLLESVDVIQNDVVLAGGVSGSRIVAGWAGDRNRVWSPHTWSTGLGLLANLHTALAYSQADYIEVPYDPPAWTTDRRDFMLPLQLEIGRDGDIAVPSGPGLGIEPDLVALERYRVG
jgi:L-alanine-DL-glutamate epimerase-like enolase superfamily enzyme